MIWLVDKQLGMFICRWKDPEVLQTVSTSMKLVFQEVQRINGQNVLRVKCPNGILEYQKNMNGADSGNLHRTLE